MTIHRDETKYSDKINISQMSQKTNEPAVTFSKQTVWYMYKQETNISRISYNQVLFLYHFHYNYTDMINVISFQLMKNRVGIDFLW